MYNYETNQLVNTLDSNGGIYILKETFARLSRKYVSGIRGKTKSLLDRKTADKC